MQRSIKTTGLMMATGLASLALLQPAWALDADAFVDRIAAVYATMGYDFQFGPARLDGDTITVDGVTVNMSGLDEPIKLKTELTFSGVAETDDGGYVAERLTVPDIDTEFSSDPEGRISIVGMKAEDLWLPPADAISVESGMQTLGTLSTGPLSVTRDGAEVIRIDGMEMASDFSYDGDDSLKQIDSRFSVSGIWADLSTVKDEEPEAGAVIEALGLTHISGDIDQSMSWTMADGHMVIDRFLFDFADVGALDFKADISGFTIPVLEKIYALQASDLDPQSEAAQAQQMMLGMELLQAFTLAHTSLRYDDAGLANNLLDFFASQSGAERAQFVAGLKAMLPGLVGQAGIPALTDMVVPEANNFLDDPQSFEIALKPANPTTLLVLSAAAANPAGLISAIGLKIAANQPSAD